jgi:anaphase-promoting complex subunit 1
VREAIAACRANPPAHWSAAAFRLVGRPDLAVDVDPDASKRQRLDAEALATHTSDGALDVRDIARRASDRRCAVEAKRLSANAPGELRQRVCELRFGRDRRLADVCRAARDLVAGDAARGRGGRRGRPRSCAGAAGVAGMHFANRTLALPIGRGMFTFATAAASPADLIARPKFALDGRVLGSNASVQLESSSVAADFGRWPNFHNGAASALRVARDPSVVTSPWIVFNKPPAELTSSYAGTLLALGLTGQLSALALTKVYDFLAIGHEMTSISILIGMAASQRGTMHVDIAKLLTIHLPSLHASSSTDLEVPASLQTAALLGVGLLYESTCHRHMTEVLLEEMGRRATDERHFDRESYALSAGLALGFVALGNGRHASLADLSSGRSPDALHRRRPGGGGERRST